MGLIGALVPLLLGALGGAALTLRLTRRLGFIERLALGVPLGVALQGLVGLLLAHAFGLTVATALLSVAVSAAPLAWLSSPSVRTRLRSEWAALRRRRVGVAGGIGIAALATLLFFYFQGACYETLDGAIQTTNPANFGDLPFHIGIVRGFVDGGNLPPDHPEFHGARLTYPFLSDFVAAQYVRLGTTLFQAYLCQNLSLVAALCYLLAIFARRLSGAAPGLALPLAIFSGGWGFLIFFGDAAHDGLRTVLGHLPHNYTIDPPGLRFGTMLNVLLGTQRSIVLGMPLGIGLWNVWWKARLDRRGVRTSTGAALLSGLLIGILPLCHVHTFLVSALLGGLLALRSRQWRAWCVAGAVALAFAAAELAFMLSSSSTRTGQFVGFHPFWDSGLIPDGAKGFGDVARAIAERGGLPAVLIGWAAFWLRNTALAIPLTALALWQTPRRARGFVVSALLVGFVLPNLVQLAPWIWDNLKVIVWAHLIGACLVAGFLTRLWRRGPGWAALAVVLALVQTLSGALDVWRTVSHAGIQEIATGRELAFGEVVRRATEPRARILAAPTFNHPVFLAGRRVFTGYGGHLWSHGLDYGPREQATKRIYEGAPDADELIRRWGIDYIAIGDKERQQHDFTINDDYLSKFPIVAESEGQTLRRVVR